MPQADTNGATSVIEASFETASEAVRRATDAIYPARSYRLDRDLPGHAALFAQFANRVRAMSQRLNGNAEGLYTSIWEAFGKKDPRVAFWAFVNTQGQMVGHFLADIRHVNAEWICYVIQEAIDDPQGVSQGLTDAVICDLEHWIRSIRMTTNQEVPITRILMETCRPGTQWTKRYGFTEHSRIYERRVS